MRNNPNLRRKITNLSLFALGILLFYLFISRFDVGEVWQVMTGANFAYCFLGALIYGGTILARSSKWLFWGRLLRPGIKYCDILPFYLTNSLIGNLTPLKSGEAATPFFLKKFLNASIGRGFSLIILDRFSELLVFIFLLLGAVFYLLMREISQEMVLRFFVAFSVFISFVIFIIFIILFFRNFSTKIISRLSGLRIFNGKLDFVGREARELYQGIDVAKEEKIFGKIIILTLIGWLFEFSAFYVVTLSVFNPGVFDLIAAQTLTIAASLVAFVPNGLGVGEFSATSLLSLMGYPLIQVVGAMLLVRVFLSGTLVLSGLAGLFFIKEKN